ncbi:uncharacterized protein [Gossypium hirsutum]|uniref:Retrotransposon gag domain-containing protein n=1 Tax=Gossypium hirsutum TaxID=3635 RepID=A0A1U8IAT3_GOSHI|nr:uncharacterized protein LOC107894571 [Gossypium hirsutum]
MPNVGVEEAPASPMAETGPYDRATEKDTLSQAMLKNLERVAGPNNGTGNWGSILERFRSNGAEIFKGVASVALNTAEYWLEATKRIMEDLDCSPEQKLKGAVSLLRKEAYQWWLTVKENTQPEQVTWEFFKTGFQGKYLGASYVDARRKEFLNLTQGNKSVAEYETEFLRLSRYARAMVAMDYERCVRFEDGLRDSLKRPRARAKFNGPIRAGPLAINPGVPPYANCGKGHVGECWKRTRACLACIPMEHRIRNCPKMPAQVKAVGQGGVQPPKGGQLLPRARGQARVNNSNGRGRRASGRNAGHVEANS